MGRPGQTHQRLAAVATPVPAGPPRAAGPRFAAAGVHWRLASAGVPALLPAVLLGALLAGCANAGVWGEGDEQSCVREAPEGPTRRIINYVDPELCGRSLRRRSSIYVRVLPPPGMRSR